MRLILFAILLAVVYSLDDILDVLLLVFAKLRNKKHFHRASSDGLVGAALLFFAIPLTLLYYLNTDASLLHRLTLVSTQLILIAILSVVIRVFNKRLVGVEKATGWEKLGILTFATISTVSPVFHLFSKHAKHGDELAGKFAAYLSLPFVVGIILVWLQPQLAMTEDIIPDLNSLIVVLIGGLTILIAIEFLERHFRLYKFHITTLARIILGIAIIFIISENLV